MICTVYKTIIQQYVNFSKDTLSNHKYAPYSIIDATTYWPTQHAAAEITFIELKCSSFVRCSTDYKSAVRHSCCCRAPTASSNCLMTPASSPLRSSSCHETESQMSKPNYHGGSRAGEEHWPNGPLVRSYTRQEIPHTGLRYQSCRSQYPLF